VVSGCRRRGGGERATRKSWAGESGPRGGGEERMEWLGRAVRRRRKREKKWPGWAAGEEKRKGGKRERVDQLGWAQKKKREGKNEKDI
jgi:hypothetical protein